MKYIKIKNVITRKPHECYGCSNEFESGMKLMKVVVQKYKLSIMLCLANNCKDRYSSIINFVEDEQLKESLRETHYWS